MDGRLTLAALLVAFFAWLAILIIAWPTWEGLNHAAGAVAACADGALHGESPGSGRGTAFLGTISFPPVPLLVGGAHATGMSWHAALRWVDLLSVLTLIAAVALCSQSLGGGGVAMTVSLALLLISYPFVRSSLSGQSDPLAAALAIGALAAWCIDPRRRGWIAPALAAATWLVKPTSFTLPLAVMIAAFGPGARRGAGPFAARFFAAIAAGVVLTMPWRGLGWYGEALSTLVFAGPNTSAFARGPFELLRALAGHAELAAAAGLAFVYLTGEWSRARPIRPFAIASFAVAMVVLMNRGTDHVQLLELTAVACVAAGLWAEHATRREAVLGMALVLLAVTGAAWRETSEVGRAASQPSSRRGEVTAAVRAEPGAVLCEDPLLALEAGRRPEISDASVLRSRLRKKDPRARAIVDRIVEGRYGLIVLNEDLAAERERRYRDFQFGTVAAGAMAERYVAAGTADGYHLYRLRVDPTIAPLPAAEVAPAKTATAEAPAESSSRSGSGTRGRRRK